MQRRDFLLSSLTCTSGIIAGEFRSSFKSPLGTRERASMKVGSQQGSSNEILEVLSCLGVDHICSSLPSPQMDENWSVEGLMRLRDRVESYGIKLEMIPLPLSSNYITEVENPNILLGKSPQRDREIDKN